MKVRVNHLLLALIVLGFGARLILVVHSGNRVRAPWSAGGDSLAYVSLAGNLVTGEGFSYAGMPTAFRPPIYPLVLAGAQVLVGTRYILFIRIVQLFSAIIAAWLCAGASGRLWGGNAGLMAFACFAASPTLIYLNSEILTESFAVLLTCCFLYLLISVSEGSNWVGAKLGFVTGLSMLLRFNAVVLPLIAGWRLLQTLRGPRRCKQLAMFFLLLVLLLAPWLIRNLIVFNGDALYSTHTGWGLVLGVYDPQGRGHAQEYARVREHLGWVQEDIETNDASRSRFGPEDVLNNHALEVGRRAWDEARWSIPLLIVRKLGYFWLSLDQLSSVSQFSLPQQVIRRLGVLLNWVLLLIGLLGLFKLHKSDPALALTFLLYAIACTAVYVPFAMNTRLRAPSIEPLLCVLAGAIVRPSKERVPACGSCG